MEKPKLSFVSPIYLGENYIELLIQEIELVMLKINLPYEIILVDDRSPDNSWFELNRVAKSKDNLKCIRLSKNFGQHPAIMAGLSKCQGDWIVVLDCDLQDQPKEVYKLYLKALEGYDVVLAKRKNRKDNFIKKLNSKLFAIIFSFFTETNYDNQIANFGIYNKKVINSVLQIPDVIKFFPLFVKWSGYNITSIEVEHNKREIGKSSYSFYKLLSLAFNAIISFSNKPLKMMVKFGMIVSIISFLIGIYNIYLALTNQIEVLGYSSIIVSLWFIGGVIITSIGITGIYIGKIFDQTKNRPSYIIDEIK